MPLAKTNVVQQTRNSIIWLSGTQSSQQVASYVQSPVSLLNRVGYLCSSMPVYSSAQRCLWALKSPWWSWSYCLINYHYQSCSSISLTLHRSGIFSVICAMSLQFRSLYNERGCLHYCRHLWECHRPRYLESFTKLLSSLTRHLRCNWCWLSVEAIIYTIDRYKLAMLKVT